MLLLIIVFLTSVYVRFLVFFSFSFFHHLRLSFVVFINKEISNYVLQLPTCLCIFASFCCVPVLLNMPYIGTT